MRRVDEWTLTETPAQGRLSNSGDCAAVKPTKFGQVGDQAFEWGAELVFRLPGRCKV
ncbi:MAG TPA: hypothetical protein VKB86_06475 [Pyrinomonadaceae bacterium]|nr:hypothetical protein [Pyrinomonadaceae bacterium]